MVEIKVLSYRGWNIRMEFETSMDDGCFGRADLFVGDSCMCSIGLASSQCSGAMSMMTLTSEATDYIDERC